MAARSTPFPFTLRALARLLSYPDAELRAHLGELRDALHAERALSTGRLAEIDALVDELRSAPGLQAEAAHVELFDRGRSTSLHLFEHVHGDSRDRGPAMVDLVKTYEQAGLFLGAAELPDHLCVLLEFASTRPADEAVSLLGEVAHILQAIRSALDRRGSRHAGVVAALLDLAGEPVGAGRPAAAEEPSVDETWQEPAAFGGCPSSGGPAGQSRPPQPVQFVRSGARA